MKTPRTSPRRCRQMPPMLTAPASAHSSRMRSTCSGESLMPGISGAISTPVGMPARLSSATASIRLRGCGVCGSLARQAFSSRVGIGEVGGEVGDLLEELDVPQEQRRLGEHRAGRAGVAHGLPDARQQLVLLLDPLVRIGVGAERDVLVLPRRLEQLGPGPLGRVDLDDDLALEVTAGVEVEVGVGGAGEAVNARMSATPVGVDRPAERHPRRLRHLVQDRAGLAPRRSGCRAPRARRRSGRPPARGIRGGGGPPRPRLTAHSSARTHVRICEVGCRLTHVVLPAAGRHVHPTSARLEQPGRRPGPRRSGRRTPPSREGVKHQRGCGPGLAARLFWKACSVTRAGTSTNDRRPAASLLLVADPEAAGVALDHSRPA